MSDRYDYSSRLGSFPAIALGLVLAVAAGSAFCGKSKNDPQTTPETPQTEQQKAPRPGLRDLLKQVP